MPATDLNALTSYRRAFARRARWIKLRRVTGQAGQGAGFFDAVVQAIVDDYVSEPPVGTTRREGAITQGGRRVIVLSDDLAAKRFPLPVRKNDKVILLEDQPQPADTVGQVIA